MGRGRRKFAKGGFTSHVPSSHTTILTPSTAGSSRCRLRAQRSRRIPNARQHQHQLHTSLSGSFAVITWRHTAAVPCLRMTPGHEDTSERLHMLTIREARQKVLVLYSRARADESTETGAVPSVNFDCKKENPSPASPEHDLAPGRARFRHPGRTLYRPGHPLMSLRVLLKGHDSFS